MTLNNNGNGKMNFKSFSSICVLVCLLTACGGSANNNSTYTPAVLPKPAPYTMTPAIANASTVAGFSTSIEMIARQTTSFVGTAFLKVIPDKNVIEPQILITPNPDASFTVKMKTSASLPAGSYKGNFAVNVCQDVECTKHIDGSPFQVPYEIEVIPAVGGVTPYQLTQLKTVQELKDWETFQANSAHTGFVPMNIDSSAISLRWKWYSSSEKGVQKQPSKMAIANGLIFITQGEYELLALKEYDGATAWSLIINDSPYPYGSINPPAVSGGKVFVVAGSQHTTAMFGIDASNGNKLFKSKMSSQWEHYLAPTIANGMVYTDGGAYGGMYAFDMISGKQNIFLNLSQWDGWTPAIDKKFIYTYTGGSLSIHDAITGGLIGSISDPAFTWNGYTVNFAPIIASEDTVFAGNFNDLNKNAITNFDTKLKVARWSIRGAYSGNPAYDSDILYLSNNKTSRLEAVKRNDGTISWDWSLPLNDNTKFIGDVLATSNLLFVSSKSNVYAIDRNTHQTRWTYPISGAFAVSANGVLYVKGENKIFSFNLYK